MPGKKRRGWVGWVLLLLLFVGIPVGASVAPFVIGELTDKEYFFPRVEIDATVRPDGSLDLVEDRTFDFEGDFSYAFFTVAWPADQIQGFTVSEGGRPLPVDDESVGTFQARWHFTAEDEQRTFRISYTAQCAVDVWQDTAQLYWQFIGTGWEVPTESALVTLHLPHKASNPGPRPQTSCPPPAAGRVGPTVPLAEGDTRAWGHGPLQGEVRIVDPQTVEFEVADLPASRFVEGDVLFPKEAVPLVLEVPTPMAQGIVTQETRLAEEANRERRVLLEQQRKEDEARRVVWYALIGIPIAMILLLVISKLRDRVSGVPSASQAPPEDMHPLDLAEMWQGYDGALTPSIAYRTELMHLVGDGTIEMNAVGTVTDPEDLTIRLRRDPQHPSDDAFVKAVFDGTKDASLKDLAGTYSEKFGRWWRNALMRSFELRKQMTGGRWEGRLTTLLGLGGAALGIILAIGDAGGFALWLIPASLVTMFVVFVPMDKRVEKPFRERLARWGSFRRFLQRFSALSDAPAMAAVVWERYLAYASALGVADEVEDQVTSLIPADQLPSPWQGSLSGTDSLAFVHALNTTVSAPSTSSPSSSDSSSSVGSFSSSGGGGGGFSGGGGGGGGGTGGGAG